jgi:hypothetical protein
VSGLGTCAECFRKPGLKGLGPRPAVAGGVGSGDMFGSRKSGNEDELRRASAATDNSEGLCCIEGARATLAGLAACFLSSLASRGSLGRGDATLVDFLSSGSESPCSILFCLILGDPPVTVLLLPTFAV